MKFIRIIRSADNNYWIFGNEYVNINQGLYIDLIKIDSAGNMLTSVQLDLGSSIPPFSEVEDVASLPDGGFILMVNNSLTFGSTYSYIIRCDAQGRRDLAKRNYATWPRNRCTNPSAVHPMPCSSRLIITSGPDLPNFGVERVDLKTGNLMWYKRYTIGNNNARINRIFSINDTTYTFVNNFAPDGFNSIPSSVMVKVDPAG